MAANGKLKCQQSQENNGQVSYVAWSEHVATCGKILSFLDTLEVKEVDLEKEYEEYVVDDPIFGNFITNDIMGMELAKHFFELGLKAQKGEISYDTRRKRFIIKRPLCKVALWGKNQTR